MSSGMKQAKSYLIGTCLCILLTAGPLQALHAAGDVRLSPEQREQLKSLASEIRTKTIRERGRLMQARRELLDAYRDYDMDERRVRVATGKVNESQLDLLNLHLENQTALRRILSKDQIDAFCSRMKGRGGGPMIGMSHHEEGPLDRLPDRHTMESLGLNQDQMKQIWKLAASPERRRAIDDLRRDSRRVAELYSRDDLDTAAAKRLIDSIHRTQITLSELTHKRQQALRHILTKQQFERLMDNLAKHLRHRTRPGKKA